jgi:hypothetical protein
MLRFLDGNGVGNNIFSINGTSDVIGINNNAVGTTNIGFVGGTNTVNGITNINTTTYNLTTVGNGSSNQQLKVVGTVDAANGDAPANGHWDVAVAGDLNATGILQAGVGGTPNWITVNPNIGAMEVRANSALTVITNGGAINLTPGSGTTNNNGIFHSTNDINTDLNVNVTQNLTVVNGNIVVQNNGNISTNNGSINAGGATGKITVAGADRIQNNGTVVATGIRGSYNSTAANYTIDVSNAPTPDYFLKLTGAAAGQAVTLPNAAAANLGRIIVIRNTTVNNWNVGVGAGTIDGALPPSILGPGITRTFVSSGAAGDWVSY